MIVRVRTLAILLLVVLAVRAAVGQQYQAPPAGRPDPYNPPAAPGMRYPLPGGVITNSGALPPAPRLTQPPQPTQTAARPLGSGQAARYPLPQQEQQPPQQPAFNPPPSGPPNIGPSAATPGQTAASEQQVLFEPGQIVAVVGNQHIFHGDVAPNVNQMIEAALAKAPNDEARAEIEGYREKLMVQMTRQAVDTKLLYLGFMRDIERKAPKEKLAEIRQNIEDKTRENFDAKFAETREKIATLKPDEIMALAKQDPILPRLAMLMNENNLESMAQLDVALRRYGSSLAKQQRAYKEYGLGRMHLGEKLKERVDTEVTHQQMLDYYKSHPEKFGLPAKARFEIMTVKFASFSNRAEARQKLAAMGNEVFLGGAQFAAVAKRQSEEPNANAGGYYDWTTKGSLASEAIDNAIFTLPIGSLSQFIEDDRGCHIVRVIERQDAGSISFPEAQKPIKEAIVTARREQAYRSILQEIQSGIAVSTIYDKAEGLATQPPPAGAAQQR